MSWFTSERWNRLSMKSKHWNRNVLELSNCKIRVSKQQFARRFRIKITELVNVAHGDRDKSVVATLTDVEIVDEFPFVLVIEDDGHILCLRIQLFYNRIKYTTIQPSDQNVRKRKCPRSSANLCGFHFNDIRLPLSLDWLRLTGRRWLERKICCRATGWLKVKGWATYAAILYFYQIGFPSFFWFFSFPPPTDSREKMSLPITATASTTLVLVSLAEYRVSFLEKSSRDLGGWSPPQMMTTTTNQKHTSPSLILRYHRHTSGIGRILPPQCRPPVNWTNIQLPTSISFYDEEFTSSLFKEQNLLAFKGSKIIFFFDRFLTVIGWTWRSFHAFVAGKLGSSGDLMCLVRGWLWGNVISANETFHEFKITIINFMMYRIIYYPSWTKANSRNKDNSVKTKNIVILNILMTFSTFLFCDIIEGRDVIFCLICSLYLLSSISKVLIMSWIQL